MPKVFVIAKGALFKIYIFFKSETVLQLVYSEANQTIKNVILNIAFMNFY